MSLRIVEETVVVQSREPVAVDMDNTVVMMSIAQGKYYGLDNVGTRIWELVAEPRRVDDVCAALMAEFEVDRATCAQDVLEFLGELASEGLIEVVDEPAGPIRPAVAT